MKSSISRESNPKSYINLLSFIIVAKSISYSTDSKNFTVSITWLKSRDEAFEVFLNNAVEKDWVTDSACKQCQDKDDKAKKAATVM